MANFHLNKLTWANVDGSASGRAHLGSRTHISAFFVHERQKSEKNAFGGPHPAGKPKSGHRLFGGPHLWQAEIGIIMRSRRFTRRGVRRRNHEKRIPRLSETCAPCAPAAYCSAETALAQALCARLGPTATTTIAATTTSTVAK